MVEDLLAQILDTQAENKRVLQLQLPVRLSLNSKSILVESLMDRCMPHKILCDINELLLVF